MTQCAKYAHLGNEGNPDFDWSLYEDGWNGTGLKPNNRVKTKNGDVVYCHESYAQSLYKRYNKVAVTNTKDVKKGDVVPINDISILDDNTLVAVVGNGATNVIVDLNKEARFFSRFSADQTPLKKESFVQQVKENPNFKEQLLSIGLCAKITTDTEKGSLWDGYVEKLTQEFKEQIVTPNRAYWAEIISTNRGGFVVEVAGTIQAFMPGSMAAINRITDYESYIGKTLEVMIEAWTPNNGFVVSRKKYLNCMRNEMLGPMVTELHNNPNKVYSGTVTGATQFGVFVELNEYITGMLHKTLVSDETRDAMRQQTITPGTQIDVYVHKIEGGRVILSDVPTELRDAVIEKRTQEDNAEKSEHLAKKAALAAENKKNQASEKNA